MSDLPSLKIGEESFELVPIEAMTFGEMRAMKRLSGGMTPPELGEAVGRVDPDALNAWVLVCVRRARADAPDEYLDDVDMMPLIAALGEAMAGPLDEEDDEELEESSSTTTLGTDGPPPMLTSSASSPSTSTD